MMETDMGTSFHDVHLHTGPRAVARLEAGAEVHVQRNVASGAASDSGAGSQSLGRGGSGDGGVLREYVNGNGDAFLERLEDVYGSLTERVGLTETDQASYGGTTKFGGP